MGLSASPKPAPASGQLIPVEIGEEGFRRGGPIGVPVGELLNQTNGQALPHLRGQGRSPLGEFPEQAEFFVTQLRNSRVRKRSLRSPRRPGRDFGRPIADDHGAGYQISEPFASGMKGHQESADQVGWGKKIGGPKQVANRRGAEGDGVPGIAYHADAESPLARSLAVSQPFEKGVVTPSEAK